MLAEFPCHEKQQPPALYRQFTCTLRKWWKTKIRLVTINENVKDEIDVTRHIWSWCSAQFSRLKKVRGKSIFQSNSIQSSRIYKCITTANDGIHVIFKCDWGIKKKHFCLRVKQRSKGSSHRKNWQRKIKINFVSNTFGKFSDDIFKPTTQCDALTNLFSFHFLES